MRKVSIKGRHRIIVAPKAFEKYAKGHTSFIRTNMTVAVGDGIILREHDGEGFTAKEIVGEVKSVRRDDKLGENVIQLRKFSVTEGEKGKGYGTFTKRDKKHAKE